MTLRYNYMIREDIAKWTGIDPCF